MTIAELKIMDQKPESKESKDSNDFGYVDSFHPAILKLLATEKLNNQGLSPKAYGEQEKISFKCALKINIKPNSLLNKKVS